jgi:hypothetical protein
MKISRTVSVANVDRVDCHYWSKELTFHFGDDKIEIAVNSDQAKSLMEALKRRLEREAQDSLEKAKELLEAKGE